MRIECENCHAVYTIGDALLSDQPIGAQCPYCGHVQMVSKGDARASEPAPSSYSGGGYPSIPDTGYGGPRSVPADTGLSGLPGDPLKPSVGAGPSYQAPRGSTPLDDDFGGGAAEEMETGSTAKCQVCGTPLTDEFDKVIGLCETHQRERSAQSDMSPSASEERGGEWKVKVGTGEVLGPFTLSELRQKIAAKDFGSEEEFSKDGVDFKAIEEFPELKGRISPLEGPAGISAFGTPERPKISHAGGGGGGSSFSFGTLFVALIVLAGIAGGAVFAKNPALVMERVNQFMVGKAAPKDRAFNPLKRDMSNWRAQQPDVSGTAAEHLVEARSKHLEDSWASYEAAQKALQRALILDEDNVAALGAYVENMIIWKDELLTAEDRRTARLVLQYAKEIRPTEPSVLRAEASLALVEGDLNGCRDGAEKALQVSASDGQAQLLLASSFLPGNFSLAAERAEAARQLLPQLRRSDRVVARAYANMGRYASAVKVLEERLKVDPNNTAVLILAGQLERDLARFDRAQSLFERGVRGQGDQAKARLALGELFIETSNVNRAVEVYRDVVKDPALPAAYQTEAYAGWGRAELIRNRTDRAQELAREGLQLSPRDPSSLLIMAEATLSRSASTAASFATRALQARAGEPAALVILGRAQLKLRSLPLAEKYFEEAIQNDPRDPRLRGILAGMYLERGGSTQAFTVMRRVGEFDPTERYSRNRRGVNQLGSGAITEAVERFQEVSREEQSRSVAYASMGVLYYLSGDTGRAEAVLDKALKFDESNVTALLYAAQIQIDRGQFRQARQLVDKLLRHERTSALGRLLSGRINRGLGQYEQAREDYQAALNANPGLLSAEVELAGIDLRDGKRDKALDTLARAHEIYPYMLETRLLLLKAEY